MSRELRQRLLSTPFERAHLPPFDYEAGTDAARALPGALVWDAHDGGVSAVCAVEQERLRVHVPQVADYWWCRKEGLLAAPGEAPREWIAGIYHRLALPLFLQALGAQVFHASAVRMNGKVVAFCGDSGVGKSTTAWALGREGCTPWADDTVVLETEERGVESLGLPFGFRVSGNASKPWERPYPAWERAPFSRMYLLCRSDRFAVEELDRGQAMRTLLRQCMSFEVDSPLSSERLFQEMADLAERIPVVRMHFRAELCRQQELLKLVMTTESQSPA